MKQRLIIFMTIALTWLVTVHAAPLSHTQALSQARSSLQSRGIDIPSHMTLAAQAPTTAHDATPAYYIFTSSNAFVIAGGGDNYPAVIGYSNESTLDLDNMPAGLTELLENYRQHPPQPGANAVRKPLPPMLKSKYGQYEPYNRMCPPVDSTGTLSATGSVATAMAQIMRFHTWPLRMSKTVPSYICHSMQMFVPELDPYNFPHWKPVGYYYYATDRDTSAIAVAALMRYCCQAVKTNYGTESTASTAQVVLALTQCFDYAPTARYVQREYYSCEEWSQLIYDELSARRPVIYRGGSHNGVGHAFVVDGADSNGMYHVNWGHNGAADGYYMLSNLNPGTAIGNDQDNDYNAGHAMVIGIMPDRNNYGDNPGTLSFYNLSLKQQQFTRNSIDDTFEGVTVTGRFTNGLSFADSYDFGFAVYDNNGQWITTVNTNTLNLLEPTYGATMDWPLHIGPQLQPGRYTISAVSRKHGDNTWAKCIGSEMNNVEAVITATTLTLTPMGNAAKADYSITDATFSGTLHAGRNTGLDATVTNVGQSPLGYVYLFIDGNSTSVAQCNMPPGASDTLSMHFIAPAAGQHVVQLTTDKDASHVVWSGTLTTTTPPAAMLSCNTPSVANMRPGRIIASGTMQVKCTVTNDTTEAYNGEIVARVYRHTVASNGRLHASTSQMVSIAPGESANLTFAVDHLTENEMFSMTISYYNGEELTTMATTPFYTMLGDFKPGDLNADRDIDITDVNLIINKVLGKPDFMDYGGRDDVNADGETDISDINIEINIVLGKN